MMSVLLIVLFTLLSGIGDAQGFIYAGKVWHDGRIDWLCALKSAAGFQVGVVAYWFALRFLEQHGVVAVEVQALFWFGATVIGIALLSGQVFRWPVVDQVAAVAVLLGIAWLLYRTAR